MQSARQGASIGSCGASSRRRRAMHIDAMAHPSYNDTCEGQCCAARLEDLDVCCEGGDGGMVLPMFGDAEQRWPKGLRGFLYLTGMLWCFLGVAIIADLFMGAAASHLSAAGVSLQK